jgi:hypothetical protein
MWRSACSHGPGPPLRRHIKTGELAFHYCYVPGGQAAPAIWAITAAQLRDRTDTQAPPSVRPDRPPPPDPGMFPLTVPEVIRRPPRPRTSRVETGFGERSRIVTAVAGGAVATTQDRADAGRRTSHVRRSWLSFSFRCALKLCLTAHR